MQERDLETKSAGYFAYAAARDAAQRSYAASTSYSEQQKVAAERMKLALELMYSAKNFHINFRNKFIAIKVDSPIVLDRKNLVLMESDWTKSGVTKRTTAQGIIYRIPKK